MQKFRKLLRTVLNLASILSHTVHFLQYRHLLFTNYCKATSLCFTVNLAEPD
jgi:hypothetical protein